MTNKTELVCILDRSGSMSGLESDTIGGFNSLLEQQKKTPGEVLVSTVLFSNSSSVLHDRLPIADVPAMTPSQYRVGGCTALLDAVGDAIHHIQTVHKYIRPEDRPDKTLFVITTDGCENASQRYGSRTVKAMVEAQQAKGWEFLFLGADIDAFAAARDIGIRESHAVRYHRGENIRDSFEAVNCATTYIRCAMPNSAPLEGDWKAELERKVREAENT